MRSRSGLLLFNLSIRHILMFTPRTRKRSRANASAGHVHNGRTTSSVWNVLEGRHVHRSQNVHGFIHNDVPSALAGSSGFSMDGERLLVSTASEAAIEPRNVQCRATLASGRVDRHWSRTRVGMRDPRPVARARPGDFCMTIRMRILVWVIRVMSWGQSGILPLSEMTLPERK